MRDLDGSSLREQLEKEKKLQQSREKIKVFSWVHGWWRPEIRGVHGGAEGGAEFRGRKKEKSLFLAG